MSRELRARDRITGFTLIELMVVVAIIGVLAAIAIPSFAIYLRRSRTAEAVTNVNNLFKSAAAFYAGTRAGDDGSGANPRGIDGRQVTACVASSTALTPANPGSGKGKFTAAPGSGFEQLGFTIAGYVYYGYGIASIAPETGPKCSNTPSTPSLYTFFAQGDLDGDGLHSTFELAAGSNDDNALYHARGFYIQFETE